MGSGPSKDEKTTKIKTEEKRVVKKGPEHKAKQQDQTNGILSNQNGLRSPAKKTLPPLAGSGKDLDRNSNMRNENNEIIKRERKTMTKSIEDLQSDIDQALQDTPVKRASREGRHSNMEKTSQNTNHRTEIRSESVVTSTTVSDADLEDQILSEFEHEDYPETYAQKIARNQYVTLKDDHNFDRSVMKAGRLRKNSNEWKHEQNTINGFDPKRFQKVNKMETEDNYETKQERNSYENGYESDKHEESPRNINESPETPRKKEAVVEYDEDEDALLADIEKEFL